MPPMQTIAKTKILRPAEMLEENSSSSVSSMNEEELKVFDELSGSMSPSPVFENQLKVFEELRESISPVFEQHYERVTNDLRNLTQDVKVWGGKIKKEEASSNSSSSILNYTSSSTNILQSKYLPFKEKGNETELSTPMQMTIVEENVNIESQTFQNQLKNYGQVSPSSRNNMKETETVIKKYVSEELEKQTGDNHNFQENLNRMDINYLNVKIQKLEQHMESMKIEHDDKLRTQKMDHTKEIEKYKHIMNDLRSSQEEISKNEIENEPVITPEVVEKNLEEILGNETIVVRVLHSQGISVYKSCFYPSSINGKRFSCDSMILVHKPKIIKDKISEKNIKFYKLALEAGWIHNFNENNSNVETLGEMNVKDAEEMKKDLYWAKSCTQTSCTIL